MSRNAKMFLVVSCSLLVVSLIMGCGGGTTTDTATTTTTAAVTTTTTSSVTTTTASAGTASLSGQVAVAASDLVSSGITNFTIVEPVFRTMANTGLQSAIVSLVPYDENGVAGSPIDTTTTDSSGNYSFSDVPVKTSGYYQVVATSETIQVKTIAVVNIATDETANAAPETTIAVEMFDTVIRNDSAVSILTVDEKLLKESMGILVDETEQIVEEGTLTLASMKQENNRQVGEFAAGIKEKRGNAHLSFSNLKNSVIKENAIAATNQTEAMKVINNVAIKGAGHNYMPKTEANRVFAKALVDGVTTTLDELLDAISTATSSVIHASSTITDLETYNTSSTITDLETELNAVQTKVDNIIAGTSRETITEGTYFAFGEEDRKGTLTGNTSLDAVQAVAVLNFVKENNPGATIDDMEVVQAAYPSIVSELGISSTTPYIIIDDLFYGSYGGWKVGGRVDVYIPAGVASSLTVESVELIGTTVATFGADGDTYFLSHSDGPIIQTSSNGTTNTLTIRATLSNAGASGVNAAAANTIITQLVTYEGYEIPGPTVSFYNGTDLFTMDDSAAEIGQGTGSFELYVLPAVTDTNPIFVWSTSEVDSASMPLPPGYSWAYAVEVSVYGSTLESNSGSLTLEVNANDKYNMHGIPDSDKETLEYTSAGDLGQLFTNDAFISPIDFYSEYNGALPEYHGEKIAYRFYLQRVLLDDEGKFHGIAAGYFRFIRKE